MIVLRAGKKAEEQNRIYPCVFLSIVLCGEDSGSVGILQQLRDDSKPSRNLQSAGFARDCEVAGFHFLPFSREGFCLFSGKLLDGILQVR